MATRLLPVLLLASALLAPILATATPTDVLKPVDQVVDEVMAFLESDIGSGGIRTNDGDPEGYPVPPYFYHYAIWDGNGLWSGGYAYPGYYSVSYPAYTASVGIDAFLAYWRYSGDVEALSRAVAYADWILDHLTPADDLWGNCPYSTQTEGVMGGGWDGEAIETDKPPMFGLRLLELHDITGDPRYLAAADSIAETLVATQMTGGPEDDGRWPFRARPSDGLVTQDYTSHLAPAVRFLESMADRTGRTDYADASARAWAWILANPCNPASASYQRWEAFYEDQSPEMQTGFRDHYSAHEAIVELIRRRPAGWRTIAVDIMDWVRATYLIDGPYTEVNDYWPATYEWSGWMHATYASTLQFARTALMLHEALAGDPLQDPELLRLGTEMTRVCTYGQNTRGIAQDGRMFTTLRDIWSYLNSNSWYEQDFNTVKYFIEIMGLDPSQAPGDEDHLLAWTDPPVEIAYGAGGAVVYATRGGGGEELLKLVGAPDQVLAADAPLAQLAVDDGVSEGWHWDAATQLLTVRHGIGPIRVIRGPTAATPPAFGSSLGAPYPNPANPLVRIEATIGAATSVRVDVVDLRGRHVRTLHDAPLPEGGCVFVWDGRDEAGGDTPSGRYLVRLHAGASFDVRGVTLLR